MGNRASIEIQVYWEDAHYVALAGEAIKGMVLLNVRRPINGDKVRLLFYGKEKTSMHAGRSKTYRSERNLLSVYQTIKEFTPNFEKISPGVYRIPFKLQLPATMPSTEQYPEGSRITPANNQHGFRIQYKLQVSLGKLQKTIDVNVRSAPLAPEPQPCMVEPSSFPINTLKLIKQGEVMLGASVTDSAVGRGEELELHLACRNDSTIEIRRVAIKLVESMEWRIMAKGMTRYSSRTLVHLRDVDLPSLLKDRKGRSEVRRLKKDSSHIESTYQEIYDDLVSGAHKLDVFVPGDSRESYEGQLVRVFHTLLVQLLTRGISSNATVQIPIRIGTPRARPVAVEANGGEADIQLDTSRGLFAVQANECDIPVAQAIPVNHNSAHPEDDVQSVIVLGSDAILPAQADLSDVGPIPPPFFSSEASLPNLLNRMSASTESRSFISSLLLEPAWVRLFCGMSTSDYASVIRHTTPVSDQFHVALLLAEYVNGGDALTCAWAAAAVQATEQHFRASTVQKLLPLCTDILQNHARLRQQLTVWEQTVTQADFTMALESARHAR